MVDTEKIFCNITFDQPNPYMSYPRPNPFRASATWLPGPKSTSAKTGKARFSGCLVAKSLVLENSLIFFLLFRCYLQFGSIQYVATIFLTE